MLSESFQTLFAVKWNVNYTIRPGNNKDTVVVTTSSRDVILYNIQQEKVTKDWSVKSGHPLVCPAVWDSNSNKFIAVVQNADQHCLISWKEDAVQIEKKSKTVPLPYKVHCILTIPGVNPPLIVYENGTCASLNVVLPPTQPDSQNKKTVWCESWASAFSLIIQEPGNLRLASNFAEDPDLLNYSGTSGFIKLPEDSGSPISYCVQCKRKEEQGYMTILTDKGCLYKMGTMSHEIIRIGTLDGVNSYSSITDIDGSHIAIAGILSSEGPEKRGVAIYDTEFGVLKSWKSLPVEVSSKTQVYNIHRRLLVRCGQNVYSYNHAVAPSKLSDVLGKVSANTSDISDKTTETLQKLLDPSETKSLTQFKNYFKKISSDLSKSSTDSLTLGNTVTSLVKRCIAETKFWPRDELQVIIKSGLVPVGVCGELIRSLVSHKELVLLHNCLQYINDIPEKALVNCLTYFLSCEDGEFGGTVDCDEDISSSDKSSTTTGSTNGSEEGGLAKPNNPFGAAKSSYINAVLNYSYNDAFLVEALQQMDFKLTLELLKYILYLLYVTSTAPKTDIITGAQISLLQTVDWVNHVLDANFTQVVLSTDVRPLLLDLHQICESQIHFYDELVSLEGILSSLKEKCALPPQQSVGLYCIQTLHIL